MIKQQNSKDPEMLNYSVKRIKKTLLGPNKRESHVNKSWSVKGKKMSIIDRKWRESPSNNVLLMKTLHKYKEFKCGMFKSWINLI